MNTWVLMSGICAMKLFKTIYVLFLLSILEWLINCFIHKNSYNEKHLSLPRNCGFATFI